MTKPSICTLEELRASGYRPLAIKAELRKNLLIYLKQKKSPFAGIIGYEDTVLPELETAVLARHNILLLGLRGQAKTRLARQLTVLLDEWIPVLADTPLNEDPLAPVTAHARELIADLGGAAPVDWLHRSERYVEKLATPDVTVADLIGDLDPIKAASLKISYADERAIHYGLIPRANRSLFVINELPDLQPRIQVALFNLLEEHDVQIRGFKVRLPLDICFLFTANPEDYTNRGSIVTPLKDRIESQILTHYPKTPEISRSITQQEADLATTQKEQIHSHELIDLMVEQIAFEARESEYVDPKSGVSARLTIAAYENLFAAAERRLLLNGEFMTHLRVLDLYAAIPAITGKIELVYEGEQEGPFKVAFLLINKSVRKQFLRYFPNPEKVKKKSKQPNPYQEILDWFGKGNTLDIMRHASDEAYRNALMQVPGLKVLVQRTTPGLDAPTQLVFMELVLHGLAEFSQLSKHRLEKSVVFKDMFGSLFNPSSIEEEEEDY